MPDDPLLTSRRLEQQAIEQLETGTHDRRRRERRELGEKTACPCCAGLISQVLARTVPQTAGYTRHRKCLTCGAEYETREMTVRLIRAGGPSDFCQRLAETRYI